MASSYLCVWKTHVSFAFPHPPPYRSSHPFYSSPVSRLSPPKEPSVPPVSLILLHYHTASRWVWAFLYSAAMWPWDSQFQSECDKVPIQVHLSEFSLLAQVLTEYLHIISVWSLWVFFFSSFSPSLLPSLLSSFLPSLLPSLPLLVLLGLCSC